MHIDFDREQLELMRQKRVDRRRYWVRENALGIISLVMIIAICIIIGFFVGRHFTRNKLQDDISPETQVSSTFTLTYDDISFSSESEKVEEAVATTESKERNQYYDIPLSIEEQDIIFDACKEYGLYVPLVLGLIKVESEFDPGVVSSTDDYGLMQINSSNFLWLDNIFGYSLNYLDPFDNINAGCYCLSVCLKFAGGDFGKALMAYNMGTAKAQEYWASGVCISDYAKKVLDEMIIFESDGKDNKDE